MAWWLMPALTWILLSSATLSANSSFISRLSPFRIFSTTFVGMGGRAEDSISGWGLLPTAGWSGVAAGDMLGARAAGDMIGESAADDVVPINEDARVAADMENRGTEPRDAAAGMVCGALIGLASGEERGERGMGEGSWGNRGGGSGREKGEGDREE